MTRGLNGRLERLERRADCRWREPLITVTDTDGTRLSAHGPEDAAERIDIQIIDAIVGRQVSTTNQGEGGAK